MDTSFIANELIAMLHIPVDSILASPRKWRRQCGLPQPTKKDWDFIGKLERNSADLDQWIPNSRSIQVIETQCRSLSFYNYLEERMLSELRSYVNNGVHCVMLENIAAPYFSRDSIPVVISGVMGCLAETLRRESPELHIGIQILAFGDNQAMQIAVRKGLNFIRTESTLFKGTRPEGATPNNGNLAQLYLNREILAAEYGMSEVPDVIVDLQKKHTVFSDELADLDLWLDTIVFEKLEGIIITGESTGTSADLADLDKTRCKLDALQTKNKKLHGYSYSCPLFIGSGITLDTIEVCKKYSAGAIVGSEFKQGGFWENNLDPERVKQFMKVWNT